MKTKSWLKLLAKVLAGSVGVVAVLAIVVALVPPYKSAVQIDFTRHLSWHHQDAGNPKAGQESFFGVPGTARLIVTSDTREASATVRLNGETVASLDSFNASLQSEFPVALVKDNEISAVVKGPPGSLVSVRVKQIANLEMHVQSRIHFNANVSDFPASRAFYGKLGFKTISGFPDTNTLEMAQAIGIETPTSYDGSQGESAGGYLLHGELIGPGGFGGGIIDLIEFKIPRSDAPPYAQINHLGMAKAAMYTTNISGDYEYMTRIGVKFISPPAVRSDGTSFAIFTDPDGIFYELIEVEGDDKKTQTTHITRVGRLNINVSDFERSRAWYQMMGYDVARKLASTDSIEVARAMGFEDGFEINGALLAHRSDDSTVELVQWMRPYNPERAYPIPVNHIGMHRTAFLTGDIEADVATLKSQGVQFLSDITPCCSGEDSSSSIIAFHDPDGTIVELADAGFMSKIFSALSWFRAWKAEEK